MDKQKGFSLIEVLISLTLASAFSLALLNQILNSKIELKQFLKSNYAWQYVENSNEH